jgi:chemotaxis protein CheD
MDPPRRRETFYLPPGQLAAFCVPTEVTTVLGSCVAVCLWDRRQEAGGMNHFLLPHWSGLREFSPRVAAVAMSQLLERMGQLGSRVPDLEARLFGGAHILSAGGGGGTHLGDENAQEARRLLAEAGIPIVAEDTGGDRGRKLVFHTDSGTTHVHRL